MSHTNTVEMISGRTGTDDSRSYSTYEKRSIEDYDDDYRRYDVSHPIKKKLHRHMLLSDTICVTLGQKN